jgi:hypothetical protein
MNANNLNNEFKPYYTVAGTNYGVYYDYAIIKLNTIFDSLSKIGLVKRFDATIRLWINTGTVSIPVSTPNTACDLSYNFTKNTFGEDQIESNLKS